MVASNTPNLGLHKKDPITDGNETFNIKSMLNDNWDKIDAAVGGIKMDIPDASLTAKGKVRLNDSTNSTSVTEATTPNAVKKAKEEATVQSKAYTDQQINLVTATGIPKLISYPLLVTATTNNQTAFEIPLDTFDSTTDTLLVSINRATLDATQYTITNTVRDGSGKVTQRAKLNLLEGVTATSEVAMVVLKNVPIGAEGAINGAVLAESSVPVNRVNGLSEHMVDYVRQPAFAVTTGITTAYTVSLTPAPVSLPDGFGITIVPHVDCGASPTLKIGSMAAIPLKDQKGNTYTISKLKAGMPYTFRKVGVDFLADSGSGSSGDAQPADVLSPRTFTNLNGDQIGTMVNQGARVLTPSTSNVPIPAGYHNGSGYVAPFIPGKKWASGTVNSASLPSANFTKYFSGTQVMKYLAVSGLEFKPETVTIYCNNWGCITIYSTKLNFRSEAPGTWFHSTWGLGDSQYVSDVFVLTGSAKITSNGFVLPINPLSSSEIFYVAYGE